MAESTDSRFTRDCAERRVRTGLSGRAEGPRKGGGKARPRNTTLWMGDRTAQLDFREMGDACGASNLDVGRCSVLVA